LDRSPLSVLGGALKSLFRYDVHPVDYFLLHFPERPENDLVEHANTLFMNRFHRSQNSRKARGCFQNKKAFLDAFTRFTNRRHFDLSEHNGDAFRQWLMEAQPRHVMVKTLFGTGGKGVMKLTLDYRSHPVLMPDQVPFDVFFSRLISKKFLLAEEFVTQHPLLMAWNPSCVNTIRVITLLQPNGRTSVFAAILRLGSGAEVDNFHSGGIAVLIDLERGTTQGRGFRMEPSNEEFCVTHPITQVPLEGLAIPFWKETLHMVTEAASVVPGAGTVGWDMAITPDGPCIIEGNDNWDKIILEKALGRGIRKDLEPLMQM
jgi:hypothetical protein